MGLDISMDCLIEMHAMNPFLISLSKDILNLRAPSFDRVRIGLVHNQWVNVALSLFEERLSVLFW